MSYYATDITLTTLFVAYTTGMCGKHIIIHGPTSEYSQQIKEV